MTKEEKELETKGLERNEKDLKELVSVLVYNEALIAKQKYHEEFDDKWRSFLRQNKNDADQKNIDAIKTEIDIKKEMIEIAKKNLKEGVEIKTHQGIG